MKDYLDGSHNWEKCGTCSHFQISHTNWIKLHIGNVLDLKWEDKCHVTHDGPIKLLEQCPCTEWIPENNLDCIEFLAQKRNLITKGR